VDRAGGGGSAFCLAFLSRRRTWLTLLFLALAIAACGLAAGQMRSLSVAAPVLQEKTGPVEVRGRLVEAGIGAGQQRYVLDNLSIRGVPALETLILSPMSWSSPIVSRGGPRNGNQETQSGRDRDEASPG